MTTTLTSRTVQQQVGRRIGYRTTLARKIVAVVVIAVGGVLVAMTLAANLFKVGPAFEGLTDDFRPIMTEQSIQTAQQDIANLGAVNNEMSTKLGPALAQQLGMTPVQLQTFVGQQFPAVAAGQAALPTMVPAMNNVIATLDQQRPLFASADQIPTSNLPATTVPWGFFAAGLIIMGAGAYLYVSPRAGAVLVTAIGAVLVALPLALSLPQKAADADQLNANLKPVYTAQMVDQAQTGLTTVAAMGVQMRTEMLPALAQQLNMQPAQLQAYLGQNFPATAAALQDMPAAMARFQHLVGVFDANLANYDTLKPVELLPLAWLAVGAGIALMLVGIPMIYLGYTRR